MATDEKSTYYDAGGIETIDIIRAKLTKEQFHGYCLGNMIKYTCRAQYKGTFDRDIEKAGMYARFLLRGNGNKMIKREEVVPGDIFTHDRTRVKFWIAENDDGTLSIQEVDGGADGQAKG